ncbi:MAG: hypothetical protein WBA74_10905 [Cyclobacteriaceae bacterium]
MKKVFTRLLLLGIISFTVYACDNGNADITLLDSAPDVVLTNAPAGVVQGNDVKIALDVSDGAFESSSLSPIATIAYTLTDTLSGEETLVGSFDNASGRAFNDTLTISTEGFDLSVYKLVVLAADTKGLSQSAEVIFEVVENFSVGLLGSATAGGFDVDIDMERDESNLDLWKLGVVPMTTGEAKFRKDDAWDVNWGGSTYPIGIAELNGPNIPIPADGDYEVTFNSNTLEYSFKQLTGDIPTPIGIIGSATPGGWGSDTDMQQVEGTEDEWTLEVELTQTTDPDAEGVKFRKDNDWAVNWGGDGFPSGVGTQDGANIQIPETATYLVTFNSTTGAYNFEKQD